MKYPRAREHLTEQEARSCFLNCIEDSFTAESGVR